MRKVCSSCLQVKDISEFNRDKSKADYLQNKCGNCQSNYKQNWYQRNKESEKLKSTSWRCLNPDKRIKQANRYKLKYPEKVQARNTLKAAIKNGAIIKSKICSECYQPSSRIEGHHPDYSMPYKIIWLCHQCHANLHKRILHELQTTTG